MRTNETKRTDLGHILELGCGASKSSPLAYGVDRLALPGVDLVHDLDLLPWPLATESFDKVIALDVLEHLEDMVGAVTEIHRVLRPGGMALIRMPFAGSVNHYTDPTHRRGATSRTFDYFTSGGAFRKYSYTSELFELVAFRYSRGYPLPPRFARLIRALDRALVPVLEWKHDVYEHFFASLYPVHNIEFHLKKKESA